MCHGDKAAGLQDFTRIINNYTYSGRLLEC